MPLIPSPTSTVIIPQAVSTIPYDALSPLPQAVTSHNDMQGATTEQSTIPTLGPPPLKERLRQLAKRAFVRVFGQEGFHRIQHSPFARHLHNWVFFKNPAAGKTDPTFVLRSHNRLLRYLDSPSECRFYIAAHRKRLNNQGAYLSLAEMGPGYEQPFHRHTKSPELNFIVDPVTIFTGSPSYPSTLLCSSHTLIYIAPHLFHTLVNHTGRPSRNLTVKTVRDLRIFEDNQFATDTASIVPGRTEKGEGFSIHHYRLGTSDSCYVIDNIMLEAGSSVYLPKYPQQQAGTDQLTINFGSETITMIEGALEFALGPGDVLYSRSGKDHIARNPAPAEPAFLYRLTLLDDEVQ